MKKTYTWLYTLLVLLPAVASAQKPNISYSLPANVFYTGSTIQPISPQNTGGAVPATFGQTTTIAGSGIKGSNDGKGTSASFNAPNCTLVDKSGNIYVSDAGNSTIRIIASDGTVSIFAGVNGSKGLLNAYRNAAIFSTPGQLAMDSLGTIYVTDQTNNVLRTITTDGYVHSIAFVPAAGSDTLNFISPTGITIDKSGIIYVVENKGFRIKKIKLPSSVSILAGSSGVFGTIDGNGHSAIFNYPENIAADSQGNLYVTDSGNKIRKITPSGNVTSIAGAGFPGFADGPEGLINAPYGICTDAANNIYISDAGNNSIRMRRTDGQLITVAGTTTAGAKDGNSATARFNNPQGLSTDNLGNLYIADAGNNTIRKISVAGYSVSPALPAGMQIDSTTGIITGIPLQASPLTAYTITAFNGQGLSKTTISFSVSTGTPPVLSYTTPQTYSTGQAINPLVPVNKGGAIPVGFYTQVTSFVGSGLYGNVDGKAADARFANALGIAKDASGNIFIADANNNTIRKITPDGTVSTFAGSGSKGNTDGSRTNASFNYPTGVTCDPQGNVYVADYGNSLIRKITPAGLVSTLAGGGSTNAIDGVGAAAKFKLPYGLAYDPTTTDLIIADSYNNRIRRVTRSGTVSTVAGGGLTGAYVDAKDTAARFYVPYAVAVDSAGIIYVADSFNGKIRKIDKTNNVTTFFKGNLDALLPNGLAIDRKNNLYISSLLPIIAKISAQGNETILAGNIVDSGKMDGVGTKALFGKHLGLMYDATTGNVLVSDADNRVIRSLSLNGYKITPALPAGLKMDSTGTINGTPTAIAAAANYRIVGYSKADSSVAVVNLQVIKGKGIISFPHIAPKTYGDAGFAIAATSSNSSTPVTYSSSNTALISIKNDTATIKGAGTVYITAAQAGNGTFNTSTSVIDTLIINKAPLTVTANDAYKIAGADNPAFTVNYSGFVNSEDSTAIATLPTATTNAVKSSSAGNYAITPGGGVAANYAFNYVPGKLVVLPVPTITANGPTAFLQGGSVILTANPDNGYSYQWYNNGIPISNANNANFTATQSGAYTVSVGINGHLSVSAADTVTAAFTLPADNFKIRITSSTCRGSNNASINIQAAKHLQYTASLILGNSTTQYQFTDSLAIGNLAPGTYGVCFTVANEVYQQCTGVNVTEPQDLSVFTAVNNTQKTVTLQLGGSASVYHISVNNTQYTTTDSTITLPLSMGDNDIAVSTDKACQGIVEKHIIFGSIAAYPNPFQSTLNVNINNPTVANVAYKVYDVADGKVVSNGQAANNAGLLHLDLSAIGSGAYYLELNIDNKKTSFKIIKK